MTPTLLSSLAGIALIFADGNKLDDFSAWSSSSTYGGDLSVTGEAALAGNYGMSAVIDDNNSMIAASRIS